MMGNINTQTPENLKNKNVIGSEKGMPNRETIKPELQIRIKMG
jgi:hypothetical protein